MIRNIYIDQFQTFEKEFQILDSGGLPVDISTYTFVSNLKHNIETKSLIPFTVSFVTDGTDGKYKIKLQDYQTSILEKPTYIYDVVGTKADASTFRPHEGTAVISNGVSTKEFSHPDFSEQTINQTVAQNQPLGPVSFLVLTGALAPVNLTEASIEGTLTLEGKKVITLTTKIVDVLAGSCSYSLSSAQTSSLYPNVYDYTVIVKDKYNRKIETVTGTITITAAA